MSQRHHDATARERVTLWVHEHGRAVRGYVLHLVRKVDVADDLCQEVFRKAWQARRQYNEQGTPRAYLLRIADRLVCDYWRRTGRGKEVHVEAETWEQIGPSSDLLEPIDAFSRREAGEQLKLALDQLSPTQRRALLLRYYGDMEFSEIAAAMECPLNTALSHCRRGLMALRKILAEDPR